MADTQSILDKNVEMWETMTGSYMEYATKAYDNVVEQTTSFQEQVREAMTKTLDAQFEAARTGLQIMERQVESLSNLTSKLYVETE
jgi:hypothetical protein